MNFYEFGSIWNVPENEKLAYLLPPHLTSSDAMIVAFRGAFVMRATSPKHWPD